MKLFLLLGLSITSIFANAATDIELDTIYEGVSEKGRKCLFRVNKYTGPGSRVDGSNDLYLYFEMGNRSGGSASKSVYGIELSDKEFNDVFKDKGNRTQTLKEHYDNSYQWSKVLIAEHETKDKSKMFFTPYDKVAWFEEFNSKFQTVLHFDDGKLTKATKTHYQKTWLFGFERKTFQDTCIFN